MKLAGKNALITGGNSGIGFATARLFVSEGAQVAITGRDQQKLDAAIQNLGSQAIAYQNDVADSSARKDLFVRLAQRFGKLDIVFINAGISGSTPAGGTNEDLFERIIRVNLIGTFLTAQSALPLLNDGASMIFTGSIDGSIGQPAHAAYAASKAGIRGMARSLATELSPRGIRVNVLSPGAVRTPIWDRTPLTPAQEAERDRRVTGVVPLGRWGEPEEIARVALFLASNDSSFVQSVELFVDGGMVGSPYGGPMFQPR
jgi:NAD(P)-dependent dehydrogenase (short-subunit alcohol dehydrogenase family)